MNTRYKLLEPDMTSYQGFLWETGKTYNSGGKGALGGPGWFYCHSTPQVSVLLNPIRANRKGTQLWSCDASGTTSDLKGVKQGWQKVTLLKQIPKPTFTIKQILTFGYKCLSAIKGEYLRELDQLSKSDDHDYVHYSVAQLIIQAAYHEEFNVDIRNIADNL